MAGVLGFALRSSILRNAAVVVVATLALGVPDAFAQQNRGAAFNVIPISFTSVNVQGEQLVANGLLGTTPFRVPLILTPGAVPDGATCPILNLQLGPINLSVLGLNVDTSPICLEITATEGGGLLGDLLCNITNLLNGGTPLADILADLSHGQRGRLNRGLTTVLNQVFAPLTSSAALAGASCTVLNLAVGPLDLSILGLNVSLDNCSDGPVTVDITATPGGGLLGDLLCNLSGEFNPRNPHARPVLALLRQIVRLLGQILS